MKYTLLLFLHLCLWKGLLTVSRSIFIHSFSSKRSPVASAALFIAMFDAMFDAVFLLYQYHISLLILNLWCKYFFICFVAVSIIVFTDFFL